MPPVEDTDGLVGEGVPCPRAHRLYRWAECWLGTAALGTNLMGEADEGGKMCGRIIDDGTQGGGEMTVPPLGRRENMVERENMVGRARDLCGGSFVTVWAFDGGRPVGGSCMGVRQKGDPWPTSRHSQGRAKPSMQLSRG